MLKVKKGDTVQVITGDDQGKKGKILKIFLQKNKVLVEGINLMKKHRRKTQQDQQGGVVSLEAPMDISNLMFVCKHCNRPARVGFTILKDGTKTRFCKGCKEAI